MSRPATGTIIRKQTSQGTSYALRVPFRGRKQYVRLGGSWEGWTEDRVQRELDYVIQQIARGEWIPPQADQPASVPGERITFRVVASLFLARQATRLKDGKDGKSYADLAWRLSHAVDYLGDLAIDRIDEARVDEMVLALLQERERIEAAADAGQPEFETFVDPRTGQERRRRVRGVSRDSVNKIVVAVGRVLREAKRRKLVDSLPELGEVRVRAEKPRRPYLELADAAAVVAGARELDATQRGLTWADVQMIRASDRSSLSLARALGVSDALIGQVRRGEVWTEERRRRTDVGRLAVVQTLLLAGPRAEHLCLLDREDVDFEANCIRFPRHKSDAGERVVPMAPALRDALAEHCAGLAPADPLFQTRDGARQTADNVRKGILPGVAKHVGLHLTPHMFRRTFASILAELNIPPRRAMYLLGHTDPTFTMRVYQHVLNVSAQTDSELEQLLGCTPDEAHSLLSGRAGLDTLRTLAPRDGATAE